MHAKVKRIAEWALMAGGAGALCRALNSRRTLVLAYHDIVPRGHAQVGDQSLHLSQDAFARQLDLLLSSHDIVPLSTLGEPARRRPRAVLTFDDAYLGAVTVGVEELARRGLPATIFVVPGLLNRQALWWDEYADRLSGTVPPAFRRAALEEDGGRLAAVQARAARVGLRRQALPDWARTASEAELREAVARPGITVAAHSWRHPNLAALAGSELREEIVRPLAWVRAWGERGQPWLAYPFGLTSAAVVQAAAEAGYAGALLIAGGFLPRVVEPGAAFCLPRFNVPAGLSERGFALRVSGFRLK